MLLIGLTGSIATGKSTVASILAAPPYNLPIIDADLLARQVVAPGTRGYAEIVEYFGKEIGMEDLFLDEGPKTDTEGRGRGNEALSATATSTSSINNENGKQTHQTPSLRLRPLNRAALGRRVFGSSPSAQRDRKVLNRITHPRVRLAMLRLILYYYVTGHWAVVLDIPLLFESGLDVFCGGVIMVAVRDPEVQMRRLLDRDRGKGLGRKEAEDRVLSQGKMEEKVARTRERGTGRGVVVWNDEDGVGKLRGEVQRAVGEVAGYVGGGEKEEGEKEGEEKLIGGRRKEGISSNTLSQKLRIPPQPKRWWTWWLWTSPWLAVLVAAAEIWRGWSARRRWELRQKRKEKQ